jgi:hypothetical protein
MAGCDKADRNRKSASNVAYKAGNRQEVNKRRKMLKAGQNPDKRPVPSYKPKKPAAEVPKNVDIMTNHARYAHLSLFWVLKDGVSLDVTPHYGEAIHLARDRGGKVVSYDRI